MITRVLLAVCVALCSHAHLFGGDYYRWLGYLGHLLCAPTSTVTATDVAATQLPHRLVGGTVQLEHR